MEWKIEYYNEKVQESIDEWPVGIRAVYARITERIVRFGPNLGMPFTRSVGKNLFEIRAKGKEGIGRAFFCTVIGSRVVILHGFIKKSAKTPKKELAVAQKRLSEVRHENT
ncbi:MAG: type II toxin-antitoxin system RelE/ParE family toxin [Candidatus Electrothrix sp. Rat3]|nr:type II toxin-antitoxin system RelE/ParE family toxin [Candidatus Electrothrix rattekaaiensis]